MNQKTLIYNIIQEMKDCMFKETSKGKTVNTYNIVLSNNNQCFFLIKIINRGLIKTETRQSSR